MKKAGFIILAGILLIGCICAAGCTTSDPVIGVWKLTEPTELATQELNGYDNYMTFINSGVGYQTQYTSGEKYNETEYSTSYVSGSSSSTNNFSWVKNNDGKYTLTFDGKDVSATYNEKTQTLTTNWGIFTKVV